MKPCPVCGGENYDAAQFCKSCGRRFVAAAPVSAPEPAPEPAPAPAPEPAPVAAPPDDGIPDEYLPDETLPDADSVAAVNLCPFCFAENEPDCRFCESCGAALTPRAPLDAAAPSPAHAWPVVEVLAPPVEALASEALASEALASESPFDAAPAPAHAWPVVEVLAPPVEALVDEALPGEALVIEARAVEALAGECRCPACDTVVRYCPCCGQPLLIGGRPA